MITIETTTKLKVFQHGKTMARLYIEELEKKGVEYVMKRYTVSHYGDVTSKIIKKL